jgi:hypothetical protein
MTDGPDDTAKDAPQDTGAAPTDAPADADVYSNEEEEEVEQRLRDLGYL